MLGIKDIPVTQKDYGRFLEALKNKPDRYQEKKYGSKNWEKSSSPQWKKTLDCSGGGIFNFGVGFGDHYYGE